jgi:hypothetical protein
MSGDTQPETPAVEEQKDAEQATQSFMAGFEEDENAERPTETPAPAPEASAPPAEPPAPKYVQITEDDWKATQSRAAKIDEISATLEKMPDQVLGTMGRTLERKLAELKTTTPTGQAVQLDEADFKELTDEFPDVGALTLKGFNKALSKIKGTGVSAEEIARAAEENDRRAEARERKVRFEELTEVHPTWQADMWVERPAIKDGAYVPGVPTVDFANWTKTLKPEEVSQLANSKSALYVSKQMDKFYAWKTAQAAQAQSPAPAPKPAAPAAPAQPSMRQRQVAAAAPAKGDSAAPPSTSAKSPFMAGFEEDD